MQWLFVAWRLIGISIYLAYRRHLASNGYCRLTAGWPVFIILLPRVFSSSMAILSGAA